MDKVLASGLSREIFPQGETRHTILNTPSPQQLALPYYNLLPRTPLDCLRWKHYVYKRSARDLEFRKLIDQASRDDICFYANTQVFVFEPRPPRMMPFTAWCDQADLLCWMDECFGKRDFGIEKTRGIGVSWDGAILFSHKLRYVPECKMAMSTKDLATLDGPDSNFLMGKVAYIVDHWPAWARYNRQGKPILYRKFSDYFMQHTELGGTIQGFAPTDAKRRSLRFTASWDDEFAYYPRDAQEALASSGGTTNCRGFVSTWHGPDNTFHDIMRREKSSLLRIHAYWWNNPERWRGCYTTEHGRLKIVDRSYKFPPNYPFVLDGLLRSPWVDFELSRPGVASNTQINLEELFGLSAERGRKLIRQTTIDLANETVRPPTFGEVDASGRDATFRRTDDGRVAIWGDIGNGVGGPFAAGCDLGEGVGASDSTLEIVSLATGEQVLEVATNKLDPIPFASLVYDVLRWVNGARGDEYTIVTFEQNGRQGTVFGAELERLGYTNIERNKKQSRVSRNEKADYLGTRNTDGGYAALLELDRATLDGEVTIRSEPLVAELDQFVKDDEGKPAYPRGASNHGDRAQGMALAWSLAKRRVDVGATQKKEKQEQAYSELLDAVNESQNGSYGTSWRL